MSIVAQLPVRVVDSPFDWPGWLTAGGTLVIAAFAAVAIWNLRDAKKTRHAALITDLSRRWDEPATRASLDMVSKHGVKAASWIEGVLATMYPAQGQTVLKYERAAAIRTWNELSMWVNMAETIGVLHSEKAISTNVVFKMWGSTIALAWSIWAKPVGMAREMSGIPTVYRGFERLGEKMLKEQQRVNKQLERKDAKRARRGAARAHPVGPPFAPGLPEIPVGWRRV